MVNPAQSDLLASLEDWVKSERMVKAAVLFGSQARPRGMAAADQWSDIDLHLVAHTPARLERVDWSRTLPNQLLLHQVVRPATGGVRKVTALFAGGEADFVLVPAMKFRLAGLAVALGLHHRIGFLRDALNSLATIMGGGYRFLKGEKAWGSTYARIVGELPGFRVSDAEACRLADVSLCDLLWVLQKLERGELVAAQRILHRAVLETNLVLLHEARTRRRETTFQQARRVESLLTPAELGRVQVDAGLQREALQRAAWRTYEGLQGLMTELVPAWRVASGMSGLLARHRPLSAEEISPGTLPGNGTIL
jgi:predicted nucleotidyltransferase